MHIGLYYYYQSLLHFYRVSFFDKNFAQSLTHSSVRWIMGNNWVIEAKLRNILVPNKSEQGVRIELHLSQWFQILKVLQTFKNLFYAILLESWQVVSTLHWNGSHSVPSMLKYANIDLMLWRRHFKTENHPFPK